MPRLSDYLAGQYTAAATSAADRPTQPAQPVVLQQAQQVQQSSSNASVSIAASGGFEAEIIRLQQQHANR